MTPPATGTTTRVHKGSYSMETFIVSSKRAHSFALHQVDCPAADKRAARAGSAVFSFLQSSYWRGCLRREGNYCAQAARWTTVSARSEERVSKTRALHARPWHSRHSYSSRVGYQDGRASPRPWALLSVFVRQATKTPAQYADAGTGQATSSLAAKRHVPNP
jgi:hypothetical protein